MVLSVFFLLIDKRLLEIYKNTLLAYVTQGFDSSP